MTENIFEDALAQGHRRVSLGLRLVAFGVLLVFVQVVFCVQQGHWTPLDLRAIFAWLGERPPVSGSPLGQSVIELVLGCPLACVPVALGLVVAGAGMKRLVHARS
jgi:hypothetical protein